MGNRLSHCLCLSNGDEIATPVAPPRQRSTSKIEASTAEPECEPGAGVEFQKQRRRVPERRAPEVVGEKRLSWDGHAYTKEEFISFFGSTEEWDKAEKAVIVDVSKGDRVESLIDYMDAAGTVKIGQVGTVAGDSTTEEPGRVCVDFATRRNVNLLPSQFKKIEGPDEAPLKKKTKKIDVQLNQVSADEPRLPRLGGFKLSAKSDAAKDTSTDETNAKPVSEPLRTQPARGGSKQSAQSDAGKDTSTDETNAKPVTEPLRTQPAKGKNLSVSSVARRRAQEERAEAAVGQPRSPKGKKDVGIKARVLKRCTDEVKDAGQEESQQGNTAPRQLCTPSSQTQQGTVENHVDAIELQDQDKPVEVEVVKRDVQDKPVEVEVVKRDVVERRSAGGRRGRTREPRQDSKPQGQDAFETRFSQSVGYAGESGDFEAKPVMDELPILNITEVMRNIHKLFLSGQQKAPGKNGHNRIYSSVGPVLIAMNPFEQLPIYSESWVNAYHHNICSEVATRKLQPHVFATAGQAYMALQHVRNQAIVICGESGAGKTFTCRKMLEFLCRVGSSSSEKAMDPKRIVMGNELLEAFGNATTTRNDNSSRFGKFTSLYFKETGSGGSANFSITGCGARHYLLERSRVAGAPVEERNFHVFYQLCRSAYCKKYKLDSNPASYKFLKNGAGLACPGIFDTSSDKQEFEELLKRMASVGFDAAHQKMIFEIIAAVLHLGNVEVSGDRDDSEIQNAAVLSTACELMGVNEAEMTEALLHKELKVPGEKELIKKRLSKEGATAQIDAVAKMVYSKIFDYIVSMIDGSLHGDNDEGSGTVGLLDIFGFEDMANNGFEQMFINLTNERIQHLFNYIMFEREKLVYANENINSDFLEGPRNIECVNLLLGNPPSVLALLRDQCRTGKPDEDVDGAVFVRLLNQQLGKHHNYKICDPKFVNQALEEKGLRRKGLAGDIKVDFKQCFAIQHYAGTVMYTVQNFITKSRDELLPPLARALSSSSKPEIAARFRITGAPVGSTVGEKFREQLIKLMEVCEKGDTLFVRCIKTNHDKAPARVDQDLCKEQLVRGGVVAALEMRAAGLPDRLTYEVFCEDFGILERGRPSNDRRTTAQNILRDLLGEKEATHHFKFGKTMVFMKSGILPWLRRCKQFKMTMYARRVKMKLDKNRLLKLDKAMQRIEEVISNPNVGYLKTIRDEAARVKKECEPLYVEFMAIKSSAGGDLDKVFIAMRQKLDKIQEVVKATFTLQALMVEYQERLDQVELAMSMFATEAFNKIGGMEQRIAEVESAATECAEVAEKKELEACSNACNVAKACFQRLGSNIRARKLDVEDVEKEPFSVPSSSPHTASLNDADKLVVEAERLGFAVLRVRREFNAALKDLEADLTKHAELLDALSGQAERCVEAGMTEVGDKLSEAYAISNGLTRLKIAAKDAAGFRERAARFVKSVVSAQKALVDAQAELERREKERALREELNDKLNTAMERLNQGLGNVKKQTDRRAGEVEIQEFGTKLDGLITQASDCRLQADSELSEWQPKVERVVVNIEKFLPEIQRVIDECVRKHKDEYHGRKAFWERLTSPKHSENLPLERPVRRSSSGSSSFRTLDRQISGESSRASRPSFAMETTPENSAPPASPASHLVMAGEVSRAARPSLTMETTPEDSVTILTMETTPESRLAAADASSTKAPSAVAITPGSPCSVTSRELLSVANRSSLLQTPAKSTNSTTITLAGKIAMICRELDLDEGLKVKQALIEATDQLGLTPEGSLNDIADACLEALGLTM